MKRLADLQLTDEMYQRASDIKRRGGRVFVVKAEGIPGAAGCHNCNGTRVIQLEYITGGPWEAHPGIAVTGNARISWIEGRWYKTALVTGKCPACENAPAPGKLASSAEIADAIGSARQSVSISHERSRRQREADANERRRQLIGQAAR